MFVKNYDNVSYVTFSYQSDVRSKPHTPGMTPPKATKTIAPEVEEKVENTVEATNTVNSDQ